MQFTLTPSAAARIGVLRQKENSPALRLRITVEGGGCSGFQYKYSLDAAAPQPGDTVVECNGAEAILDDVSLGLLSGSMLDYVEDLGSAGFEIKNPNATSSCGCGNSFSVAF